MAIDQDERGNCDGDDSLGDSKTAAAAAAAGKVLCVALAGYIRRTSGQALLSRGDHGGRDSLLTGGWRMGAGGGTTQQVVIR